MLAPVPVALEFLQYSDVMCPALSGLIVGGGILEFIVHRPSCYLSAKGNTSRKHNKVYKLHTRKGISHKLAVGQAWRFVSINDFSAPGLASFATTSSNHPLTDESSNI